MLNFRRWIAAREDRHGMGQALQQATTWILGIVIIFSGVQDLSLLDQAAEQEATKWQQEYYLRRCILQEAARRNLGASREFLAREFPSQKSHIAASESLFSKRLEHIYERSAAAIFSTASGCCTEQTSYCFRLSLETHEGQPSLWTNWIPRLHFDRSHDEKEHSQ